MGKITAQSITDIISAIGGNQNIKHCGNCMTRLRIAVHHTTQVDQDKLKSIAGVLGVIESEQSLQIILGPGKAQKAADQVNEQLSEQVDPQETNQQQELSSIAQHHKKNLKAKQNNPLQDFLSKFAMIFTPLIPGFIAAGLLLGVATLLEQNYATDLASMPTLQALIAYMKVFGKGLFAFLSIMIGYNTQQIFGGSGVNGAIIASLFVLNYDPNSAAGVSAGMSDFFGQAIDPRGNIIGVLIAAITGAYVEQFIRKIMPDDLDMILTSSFTLLVMGCLTYLVIMPLGGYLFEGMSWLFVNMNGNPVGAALLSGLFLISVVFRIHQGFVPVYFALMDSQGFNSLFPILAMAGAGQVGASLALYYRADKSSVLRSQIRGAIIPGFLGIGEPLIYGVTLPRVKPFVTACFGGAAGGFFIGLCAYIGHPIGLNTVFGPSGVVAIPLMTSADGISTGITIFMLGLFISYAVGFIATYLFGSKSVDLS